LREFKGHSKAVLSIVFDTAQFKKNRAASRILHFSRLILEAKRTTDAQFCVAQKIFTLMAKDAITRVSIEQAMLIGSDRRTLGLNLADLLFLVFDDTKPRWSPLVSKVPEKRPHVDPNNPSTTTTITTTTIPNGKEEINPPQKQ